MTDRELLELAAKAAGIDNLGWLELSNGIATMSTASGVWNPLTDDGDALRLAVKLGLDVCIDTPQENEAHTHAIGFRYNSSEEIVAAIEYHGDPYAATRRAIVRAAAEIGKAQGDNNGL